MTAPQEQQPNGVLTYVCRSCGAREPRALIVDPRVRTEETTRGVKHWTVGALIEREGRFLVMHKNTWPYLWDVIAGHLAPGEDPSAAVVREVAEETGLRLTETRLVYHGEIFPDPCRRGANLHEWYLYRGGADGELRPDPREVRALRFIPKEEMLGLPFVRPAYTIFDALKFWEVNVKKRR